MMSILYLLPYLLGLVSSRWLESALINHWLMTQLFLFIFGAVDPGLYFWRGLISSLDLSNKACNFLLNCFCFSLWRRCWRIRGGFALIYFKKLVSSEIITSVLHFTSISVLCGRFYLRFFVILMLIMIILLKGSCLGVVTRPPDLSLFLIRMNV